MKELKGQDVLRNPFLNKGTGFYRRRKKVIRPCRAFT